MKKFKYIFLLSILIVIAIYFDSILRYAGNKIYTNITYDNITITKPTELNLNSIVQNNKLYLYGLLPQAFQTKDKKLNEKIYSFNTDNNDSLMIYFTKEQAPQNNNIHNNIVIDNNSNIIKLTINSKKNIQYYKYKNLSIKLLTVKSLKLYNIYIKDIRIVILLKNIHNKIKVNKILLKLLNRFNNII